MIKHECETCEKSKYFKAGEKQKIGETEYILEFSCTRCIPHGKAYTYDCELWEERKSCEDCLNSTSTSYCLNGRCKDKSHFVGRGKPV